MTDKTDEIFSHGNQFLFPRCEDGAPSLYGLLEGVNVFGMVLYGLRSKIWLRAVPNQPDAVAACWAQLGLLGVEHHESGPRPVLTDIGKRVVACADLLEYEFTMLNKQVDGRAQATDPALYSQLRKGLSAFADNFLQPMLAFISNELYTVNPNKPEQLEVLDFCGGDGYYLKALRDHDPLLKLTLVDRVAMPELDAQAHNIESLAGDVLADNGANPILDLHFDDRRFDLIIMSEILHCKGAENRAKLIRSAASLLKPGGKLIVIEQFPNSRLEWRMEVMTGEGKTLIHDQVAYEVQAVEGLKPSSFIQGVSHYGITFIMEGK